MTFAELLQYLNANSGLELLDGSLEETLEKACAGTHRHPILGAIVRDLYERSAVAGLQAPIERAAAVNALGRLRLDYMKDDAPADAFRTIEKIVYTIDSAFNDEALREKRRT